LSRVESTNLFFRSSSTISSWFAFVGA